MSITKKIYLYFPKSETEKPIVYQLVKDFNLIINIFRAKVTPEEEGYLSLDVTGQEADIERAFAYLSTLEVVIHVGNKGLRWDAERCTHCGACVVHCPTGALAFADTATRRLAFTEDVCVECHACIPACPFGACSSSF
ncbi:MAG: 4Fe-4S binding protein [Desulfobulbaceae bacterium]|nr:4Fe-4S binding protein [Desulfobulbaceae bacterium]